MSDRVLVERKDNGVVRITLADKLNVMTDDLGYELQQAFEEANVKETRVVTLTSHGKIFCAGGQFDMLKERAELPPIEVSRVMRAFYDLYLFLKEYPLPVICGINGHAIGGGLCIAMACDIRVAHPDAKLGINFAKLGLSPGMGTTWLLPRQVGPSVAMEMLLTGKSVKGEEALRIGLVNSITSEVHDAIDEMADDIAASAPIAVQLIKSLVWRNSDDTLDNALDREALAQAITFKTKDVREGISAIEEKRVPKFKGE